MATDIIARGMASEAERAANKYVAGTNINFIPQEDGTVKITASGDVSSEDDVARELINNHKIDMNNPHNVTAEQLGLGNVDNTSDISKPISKATQNALDGKSNTNHTHTTYDSHIENVEIHVTAEEKAAWNGKADVSDISNPNLLINPDFKINQRGQTEYTSSGYTVDRWWISNTTPLTKLDNGIKFSGTGGMIRQIIENPERFAGKTVTASIFLDTIVGPALLRLRVNGSFIEYLSHINKAGLAFATFTLPEELTSLYFELGMSGSNYCEYTISNSKLELGSIATPFTPPDPAAELAKCQRYYQIHSTGDIAAVDMRPSMRTITDIKQRSDGNYEYIAEL